MVLLNKINSMCLERVVFHSRIKLIQMTKRHLLLLYICFVLRPEKGKGKPGAFGSSPKEWYSGWSAMGKLIDKGLVYKTSCPAKYGSYSFLHSICSNV